ncbi:hypothetical protein HQ45_02430 [Porphyromonas crevioricanis]|uniref:Protein of uncharacterized function (DUF3078) n=1 Tax=Porphyromonas crevioricanis TaxID=393921 RepID=A0A0A2FIR9_9PORP|nr:DUF3078 domain-containing protein [Porphyromonas crevioricanis]KGN90981.1 hypothetical protein HQ45_02430 [Porphyromonas crevioricanis]SQH73310.1 Protein of uncharacterised function (DUF3078) [Porphyromonas crevioricanis]
MKKLALIIITLSSHLLVSYLYAQDTTKNWTVSGITGLNLSQTSLTNWAAGGDNTVAGNVYLNIGAKYEKGRFSWNNTLNTDFGMNYTQANDWVKTVDKFELSTMAGYKATEQWLVSGMASFLTQYAKGYKKPSDPKENYISNFFAPAYLNLGLGAEYRPHKVVSIFMSPLTGKLTIVDDKRLSDAGAFGVKKGEKLFAELGASTVVLANFSPMKNINVVTKLSLFSAYTHDFGNIDVNWDLAVAAKINKFLSATVTTNLIYDDDVKMIDSNGVVTGAKVQFKEIVGLGLAYNF